MAVDQDRVMEFLGRFVGDLGATAAAGNVVVLTVTRDWMVRLPGRLTASPALWTTRVVNVVFPALVAGSIFTFSLTLGDYITPDLVSDAKFIGNVIYDNSSLGNLPLAAAYSLLPIVIMTIYLLVARRLGAFDSL